MTIPEAIRKTRIEPPFNKMTPNKINQGRCGDFAASVQQKCSETVYVAGDPAVAGIASPLLDQWKISGSGHVWLVNGLRFAESETRHYDAEASEGVRRWRALPCMQKATRWGAFPDHSTLAHT